MDEKRAIIRNKVWPETEAVIKYRDFLTYRSNTIEVFKGHIENLGSQGIFIKSTVALPEKTELDILIDFNPHRKPDISLKAEGVVIRSEREGFAVRFTQIDTHELGACIMKKINS